MLPGELHQPAFLLGSILEEARTSNSSEPVARCRCFSTEVETKDGCCYNPPMGSERSQAWITVVIVAAVVSVAGLLRFLGASWDGWAAAHPDERYVVAVAQDLAQRRTLDVLALAPSFPYGHLPVILLAGLHRIVPHSDLLLLARRLSALFDTMTVLLTIALGWRVGGRWTGLASGALQAVTLLHVQQAHFYTTDTLLTMWLMMVLFATVRLVATQRGSWALVLGLALGLAMASKINALLAFIPAAAACFQGRRKTRAHARDGGRLLGIVAACSFVGFALGSPGTAMRAPAFVSNVLREAGIAGGRLSVPYTEQYRGTLPFVYQAYQMLQWGLGWPLGVLVLIGLTGSIWDAARRAPSPTTWVLIAWILPYVSLVGTLRTRFPRYLMPVVPASVILTMHWLKRRPFSRRLRICVTAIVVLLSLIPSLALVSSYSRPHPWIAASAWLEGDARRGSTIAVEEWDHPLPLGCSGQHTLSLPVFDSPSTAKAGALAAILAEADYVVLASRRGYASLSRLPDRYPISARFYQTLFSGELGFRPVACFSRQPVLGRLSLGDHVADGLPLVLPELCETSAGGQHWSPISGRLDESYVVYDHPTVIVFAKMENGLSWGALRTLLAPSAK